MKGEKMTSAALLARRDPVEVILFEQYLERLKKKHPMLLEEPVATWFRKVVNKLVAHIQVRNRNFMYFPSDCMPFPKYPKRLGKHAKKELDTIFSCLKKEADYRQVNLKVIEY